VIRPSVVFHTNGRNEVYRLRLEKLFKGKPSGAKVAHVLGIHQYQATRLWAGEKGRKGIAQKLGSHQWELFKLLGMESNGQLPRLLKKYAPDAPPRQKAEDKHLRPTSIDMTAASQLVAEQYGVRPEDLPNTEDGLKEWLRRRLEAVQDAERKANAGKGKSTIPSEDDKEMHGGPGYVPSWG